MLFALRAALKANRRLHASALTGVNAILIFEKASLRTRITFETGVGMLGGKAIYMDHSVQRLGDREAVKDYARTSSGAMDSHRSRLQPEQPGTASVKRSSTTYPTASTSARASTDCLVARVYRHATLCSTRGTPPASYVGDGNNVCHSLMHCATMLGADMTVVTPKGYEPETAVADQCRAFCTESGATLTISNKLSSIERHHAVYTDVWVSMGQADTAGKRRKVFNAYQVNIDVMDTASQGLPQWAAAATRPSPVDQRPSHNAAVEVTDEVIDAPFSVVYDQAENRLHAQNALMYHILRA